eukprot:622838-Rhodomonas_salina.1
MRVDHTPLRPRFTAHHRLKLHDGKQRKHGHTLGNRETPKNSHKMRGICSRSDRGSVRTQRRQGHSADDMVHTRHKSCPMPRNLLCAA